MTRHNNIKKVEYLIEYAHIYTDERFNGEHKKSIEIVRKKERELDNLGKSHGKCILIDNYNPINHILNIDKFLSNLNDLEANPDFVMLESTMTVYCIFLLHKMKHKLKKKYLRYIKSRKKMPCSLLLTVWHVIKTGGLDINIEEAIYKGTPIIGKNLIIVLPERFKNVEELGRKILHSCNMDDIATRIEYEYF
ncbi:hypothetical protein JW887_01355 [Candidatus Dojkabacteria bacterium]|nr:hypothetical protein [Candidatus Dojkabacteria bacterium]